ncbi:hypothetical protein [Marinobacter sp. Arc7-DN-1]|uniref:hypothetical protein n=1 Tax=Marinobacter sp. Arc7-DN-1 TaxID=2304594 RepID=UPI000E43C511|nr:hypothetical protein [Marinobacter sp. Arc7-DN-1]AXS83572.1 hypothetical protein D0851_11285 [Marinobacter sp. Arc7-DN-1]
MRRNQRDDVLQCLVDPSTDKNTQIKLAKYQLIYSLSGLILGLGCMIGGFFLFIAGVAGDVDWSLNILGGESKITNAAPGAVLFIVGLFLILITKFKFRHINKKSGTNI